MIDNQLEYYDVSESSQLSKFIEIKQKSTKYQPLASKVKV